MKKLDKVELAMTYKNKKNKQLYQVCFIGRFTESVERELMVGYVALYPTNDPFHVRPYDLFLEKFESISSI